MDDADISVLHGNPGVRGYRPSAAWVAQVDQHRAQEFFKEVQALCERDGGRLWGVSVCAPTVIIDRRTLTFATSQAAPEAPRPREVGFVNAPIQWGGATWVAYMWDDVVNRPGATLRDRKELFLHELFHGVQPRLGLMAPGRAPEHLDVADGRLRLEWRALARALRASGEQRNLAVRDALDLLDNAEKAESFVLDRTRPDFAEYMGDAVRPRRPAMTP